MQEGRRLAAFFVVTIRAHLLNRSGPRDSSEYIGLHRKSTKKQRPYRSALTDYHVPVCVGTIEEKSCEQSSIVRGRIVSSSYSIPTLPPLFFSLMIGVCQMDYILLKRFHSRFFVGGSSGALDVRSAQF